jgi:hypothetical protein
MEKNQIIGQIQEVIDNYGSMHCYQDVMGGCINTSAYSNQINGIPFSKRQKNIEHDGYLQGFNKLSVVFVLYNNKKSYDSYSIRYEELSLFNLEQVLKFLHRK